MNQKKAKKLRRLARAIGAANPSRIPIIYKRLKSVHKTNKKEI